jgi:hypothetical protein
MKRYPDVYRKVFYKIQVLFGDKRITPRKVVTSRSHRGKKMHRWELAGQQETMTEWFIESYIDDPDRPGKLLAVTGQRQVPKLDRWGDAVVAWKKVSYERTKEELMKKRTIPIKALGPKRLQDLPESVMRMIAEYSMKGKTHDTYTDALRIVLLGVCSGCHVFSGTYTWGGEDYNFHPESNYYHPSALLIKCMDYFNY